MTTTTSTTTIEPRPSWAALGLGANLGEPVDTLRRAVRSLHRWMAEGRVSSLYRTSAVSPRAQPPFLNAVLVGISTLPAPALLAVCKRLEFLAGRRRGERFGPRVLDIDLLLWDDYEATWPALTLPHPRLRGRRFALEPLAEVAGQQPLPPDGRTVAEVLASLSPREGTGGEVVRLSGGGDWWH
jgi:2-amino-4-hydroxy-6-hydroxymethyldihydropteridine diphosphokinase